MAVDDSHTMTVFVQHTVPSASYALYADAINRILSSEDVSVRIAGGISHDTTVDVVLGVEFPLAEVEDKNSREIVAEINALGAPALSVCQELLGMSEYSPVVCAEPNLNQSSATYEGMNSAVNAA